MKKYLLVAAMVMFMSSASFASRFSLVGAINYGLDSTSINTGSGAASFKGGLGFGGGLLMELGPVELGGLYLSKKYTTEFMGVSTSSSVSGIHIPVLYRFGGLTSFGLGGFYDLSLESGGSSNFGITAGPRFSMTNGFFFDLNFNYGLKTGNSKDLLALIGYTFGK